MDNTSNQAGISIDQELKQVELQKLKAELNKLSTPHFSKPMNWIPLLVAVTAILTVIVQYQSSNFQVKEATLKFERESFKAQQATEKLQQDLKDKNIELEKINIELKKVEERVLIAINREESSKSKYQKYNASASQFEYDELERTRQSDALARANEKLWKQLFSERKKLIESNASNQELLLVDRKIAEMFANQAIDASQKKDAAQSQLFSSIYVKKYIDVLTKEFIEKKAIESAEKQANIISPEQ